MTQQQAKEEYDPYKNSCMDIIANGHWGWSTTVPNHFTKSDDHISAEHLEDKLDLLAAKINEIVRYINGSTEVRK